MISLVISLYLFGLAAYCNAVMDTLQFHFHRSIFSHLDPLFWDPSVSWRAAKFFPWTRYRVDAWHLFKSGMIVSMASSAVVLLGGIDYDLPVWGYLLVLLLYGLVWNATFNVFFDVWLKRR